MGELRYPNESREYREARDSLLKEEQELVDKVKSVAERRRSLPPGGELKPSSSAIGSTISWAKAQEGRDASESY
jgi:Bacterial protein of unknown function (DUF899)